MGSPKKVMSDSTPTRSAPGHVSAPGQTGTVHLHLHLPDHQRASTGELRSGQVYFTQDTQLARREQSMTQLMSSLCDPRQRVERF